MTMQNAINLVGGAALLFTGINLYLAIKRINKLEANASECEISKINIHSMSRRIDRLEENECKKDSEVR